MYRYFLFIPLLFNHLAYSAESSETATQLHRQLQVGVTQLSEDVNYKSDSKARTLLSLRFNVGEDTFRSFSFDSYWLKENEFNHDYWRLIYKGLGVTLVDFLRLEFQLGYQQIYRRNDIYDFPVSVDRWVYGLKAKYGESNFNLSLLYLLHDPLDDAQQQIDYEEMTLELGVVNQVEASLQMKLPQYISLLFYAGLYKFPTNILQAGMISSELSHDRITYFGSRAILGFGTKLSIFAELNRSGEKKDYQRLMLLNGSKTLEHSQTSMTVGVNLGDL